MTTPEGHGRIGEVVVAARARLGRVHACDLLRRRAHIVVLAAAAVAAARPIAWRIGSSAPFGAGALRALVLFAAALAIGAAALIVAAWLGRPSALHAARALDGALGLTEVVASGFAFERDGREGNVVAIARERAEQAVAGVEPRRILPCPAMRPSRRATARAACTAAIAIAIGAYHPLFLSVLVAPPTRDETNAASALENAAAALDEHDRGRDITAEHASPTPHSEQPERDGARSNDIATRAREAARAARRGDRTGALEALADIERAANERDKQADALDEAIRKIADVLEPGKDGASPSSSPTRASDALHQLANKIAAKDAGAPKDALERLERAAAEAQKANDKAAKHASDRGDERAGSDAARAADAMKKAAEALARGDRDAAARLLEQAARHVEAMQQTRARAARAADAALAALDASRAMERAIQTAMLGKEGQPGEGDGPGKGAGDTRTGKASDKASEGKSGALMARLAALGLTPGDGVQPGQGGHMADRGRSKHGPIDPNGSLRAPSQIAEGQRAVSVLRGLGRGAPASGAYKEVFPSYDAAAEEGIADETIPSVRRGVVKQYFESIRPGADAAPPSREP